MDAVIIAKPPILPIDPSLAVSVPHAGNVLVTISCDFLRKEEQKTQEEQKTESKYYNLSKYGPNDIASKNKISTIVTITITKLNGPLLCNCESTLGHMLCDIQIVGVLQQPFFVLPTINWYFPSTSTRIKL